MDADLAALAQAGWQIRLKPRPSFNPNPDFAGRYPRLPTDYISFLQTVEFCANLGGTVWFLCESDFSNTATETAFRWNEWEMLGLDAARADGDEAWADTIRAFWDEHLPILQSVKDGYAFAALCLRPSEFGVIVAGREPEFEEAEPVAPDFADFLLQLAQAVQSDTPLLPWRDFV